MAPLNAPVSALPPDFTYPFNLTSHVEEPSSEGTTTRELLLISFALGFSIILAVIPSTRGLNRTRHPLRTFLIVAVALLSSIGSVILSIVALVLGWTRDISLDALAGVVFALAPGLTQLPRDTLKFGFLVLRMRSRKSLNLRSHHFRYIRIGWRCGKDKKAGTKEWKEPFADRCTGKDCNVNFFIRALPVPNRNCFVSLFLGQHVDKFGPTPKKPILMVPSTSPADNDPTGPAQPDTATQPSDAAASPSSQSASQPSSPTHITNGTCPVPAEQGIGPSQASQDRNSPQRGQVQKPDPTEHATGGGEDNRDPKGEGFLHWHGRRVGHSKNFVQLRDLEDGITAWWWEKVSTAVTLVEKPSLYYVKDGQRMLNALALMSDIISIGDLVLQYRIKFLSWQLKVNEGVRSCITATPGIMCNTIMQGLGMDQTWGPLGLEILTDDYPTKSRKKYGILFLILAEKSQMFSEDKKSGRRNLRSFMADVKQPLIPNCGSVISHNQRMSGQDVLDKLMINGDQSAKEFEESSRKLVDEWLTSWGCKNLEDEGKYTQKLEAETETESTNLAATTGGNDSTNDPSPPGNMAGTTS